MLAAHDFQARRKHCLPAALANRPDEGGAAAVRVGEILLVFAHAVGRFPQAVIEPEDLAVLGVTNVIAQRQSARIVRGQRREKLIRQPDQTGAIAPARREHLLGCRSFVRARSQ